MYEPVIILYYLYMPEFYYVTIPDVLQGDVFLDYPERSRGQKKSAESVGN